MVSSTLTEIAKEIVGYNKNFTIVGYNKNFTIEGYKNFTIEANEDRAIITRSESGYWVEDIAWVTKENITIYNRTYSLANPTSIQIAQQLFKTHYCK